MSAPEEEGGAIVIGAATLAVIGIDCADPRALAEFYHQLLGWEIVGSEDGYAMIQSDGGVPIAFWRIDDHQPPRWPDPGLPKQFHLDLAVDDLDEAEARCVQLGATKADHQPGEWWRVLIDPGRPPVLHHARSERIGAPGI